MQQTLIAGDTLSFGTDVPEYLPADGWTLTYRLIPRTSGAVITITASTGTGDYDYDIAVPAATTAGWAAGEYSWAAYVELSGQRYTVDKGTLTVKPDVGAVTSYDGRTHARRTLDAIEAAIEGRATNAQLDEYSIAGRTLRYIGHADLLAFRSQYQIEVQREEDAERAAAGLASRRRYYVRFGRA